MNGDEGVINVLHEHLRGAPEGADQPGELEGRHLRLDQDVFREGALSGWADVFRHPWEDSTDRGHRIGLGRPCETRVATTVRRRELA